jgi:hypothetical protein
MPWNLKLRPDPHVPSQVADPSSLFGQTINADTQGKTYPSRNKQALLASSCTPTAAHVLRIPNTSANQQHPASVAETLQSVKERNQITHL